MTRPLRYSINVTLDGCVDHTVVEPNEATHRHATEFIASADALLFGRVTYELMEAGWRGPEAAAGLPAWTLPFARTIDAMPKHVVSRSLSLSTGTRSWSRATSRPRFAASKISPETGWPPAG